MKILNANPGFGTQLTEDEIRNFLGNSKLNIHIGTIDSKEVQRKKKIWTETISYTIVLMIPIHHTKELEARERSKFTRRSITIYQ